MLVETPAPGRSRCTRGCNVHLAPQLLKCRGFACRGLVCRGRRWLDKGDHWRLPGHGPAFLDRRCAKNGLDVSIQSFSNASIGATALATGSMTIAGVGPNVVGPLITGEHQQFTALAGGQKVNYSLIAEPGTKLPDLNKPFPAAIKDLKGLTLGVTSVGSPTEKFVSELLGAGGLSLNDVHEVALGATSALTAGFKAKRVDVMVAFPPVQQQIGVEGKDYTTVADALTGKNTGDVLNGWLTDVWWAQSSWVSSHEAAATGFCKSLKESLTWSQDPANLAKVVPLLAAWSSLSPAEAQAIWKTQEDSFAPKLTEQAWTAEQKFALTSGSLPYSTVDAGCTGVFK
jgi:NitT/TauT family transport system substrate-binding protein